MGHLNAGLRIRYSLRCYIPALQALLSMMVTNWQPPMNNLKQSIIVDYFHPHNINTQHLAGHSRRAPKLTLLHPALLYSGPSGLTFHQGYN